MHNNTQLTIQQTENKVYIRALRWRYKLLCATAKNEKTTLLCVTFK